MKTLNVNIISTAPFISHNGQLANQSNPFVKEIKVFSGKRKKTDDDHHAMAMLEMEGGLYCRRVEDKDVLYIPGEMMESCIINAAKLQRLGASFKRSIRVNDIYCGFKYDGPKKLEKLIGHPDHTYQVMVKVGTSKILRTRAIFNTWECDFSISYNPEIVDKSVLLNVLDDAGDLIGIGDRRPRFGTFQVSETS